ncbi:MAG: hypothetical protein P8R54_05370 [Myxococcota bacterium]|nr:hypothetical protein [Myxococcota bacterium]
MSSRLDHPAQAEAIHTLLASAGVQGGASVLVTPCQDGGLLGALQARYAVAGSDPHEARLRLARARRSGVRLWRARRDALAAPAPFDVVVFGEPEALDERDLAAALEAALAVLEPDGVLLLLPGPEPDELPAGAALMDTHDGEGLKIVCSAVVRRSGIRARLKRHWMVARDNQGVEMFSEQDTWYLYTSERIEAALKAAGLETSLHTSAAFPRGLWCGMRYSLSGTRT